jgi:hypothetical protein
MKALAFTPKLLNAETGAFDPQSGSAIIFTNGGYQVSYDELPVLQGSHKGDPVVMCLIEIPRDCPPGRRTRTGVYHH